MPPASTTYYRRQRRRFPVVVILLYNSTGHHHHNNYYTSTVVASIISSSSLLPKSVSTSPPPPAVIIIDASCFLLFSGSLSLRRLGTLRCLEAAAHASRFRPQQTAREPHPERAARCQTSRWLCAAPFKRSNASQAVLRACINMKCSRGVRQRRRRPSACRRLHIADES